MPVIETGENWMGAALNIMAICDSRLIRSTGSRYQDARHIDA